MYKLLLIWRYLLTRRIALVSVVSVTLGVATMIVVNAVMLGFSREMENRIHGALSDVTISSFSLRGFDDVDARVRDAQKVAGDLIEAITPTVTTPGMLSFEFGGGEVITRQVQIVGIDAATNERVTAIAIFAAPGKSQGAFLRPPRRRVRRAKSDVRRRRRRPSALGGSRLEKTARRR